MSGVIFDPANNNYGKSPSDRRRVLLGTCESIRLAGLRELPVENAKGRADARRTMWFRGQNVPILYGSDRKDILGSGDWIARGTIQRIGATIFATGFFCGSIALVVASPRLRDEIWEAIDGVSGQVFGTLLAGFAFLVACIGMFVTFRLLRAVVRSFYK